MSDRPDDDRPEPSPRPRRHRRVSRPATTGHPEAGHWTKNAPESSEQDAAECPEESTRQPPRRVAGSDGGPESAQDRWWREQRPPHWD